MNEGLWDNLCLMIPEKKELIMMQVGTGDQLLSEDRQEGYVDYIDFSIYTVTEDGYREHDGGIRMYKQYLSDIHSSLKEFIPDVLEEAYDYQPEYVLAEEPEDL